MPDEQKLFTPEILAQTFLDYGDAGVIGINAQGIVAIWNAWIAGRTGIPPTDAIGRPLLELFDPPPTRLWDEMQAVLRYGYPRVLSPVLHADWLPFLTPTRQLIRLVPLGTPGTEASGLLALISDLTAQLQYEAQIEADLREIQQLNRNMSRLLDELRAVNAELETFTYTVSHDLKTPLRGIDGYSRLLLEDHLDSLNPEAQLFVRNIRTAAQQMSRLIDDLLAYARLERRSMAIGTVRPLPIIESLLAEYQEEIERRKITVMVDVPDIAVAAEAEGLMLVLRNLLDNALKFTRTRDAARIAIGGRYTPETCVLWIRDNGIGFDMKYHDRIFEIFQRLQRAEDYPGTGVGLAIVRKAMQRMGGRVWAESAPGQGATFFLEMPRATQ